MDRAVIHGQTDPDADDVAEVEIVERDAWMDFYAAAPGRVARILGLRHRRIGAIGLLANPGLPFIEMNRVFGFGIGADCDDVLPGLEPDEVVRWLRANASGNWALQVPATAEMATLTTWCRASGHTASEERWAKLHLDARRGATVPRLADRASPNYEVRAVDAGCAESFGRTVQVGSELPDETADWFAALVGRPGWSLYLAFEGRTPVATGAMFVRGGSVWLGMDATLPTFRGRGAQSALIARRLREGGRVARRFTSETDQPAPAAGSDDASFRNYIRAGFTVLYGRENYTP